MKKIAILTALLSLSCWANATTISAPSSLVGSSVLNGNYAYSWGMSLGLASGQQITSAEIDWTGVSLTLANSSGTGMLYTDILNSKKTGVTTYTDNDNAGDYFLTTASGFTASTRSSIGSLFFPHVGYTTNASFVFNTAELAALNSFLSSTTNSSFAIGIDPDCHFTVGGLSFTYTVSSSTPNGSPVPDQSATALLVIASLGAIELFRRKFAVRTVRAQL